MELPKAVAGTAVGKSVVLKIWRNKKLISKRLTLGRLESSEEFKKKKPIKPNTKKEIKIDNLKIIVRAVNKLDISSRKLKEKTSGAVIIEILNKSPLENLINIDDIIIEVQKKSINKPENIDSIIDNVIRSGEKNILLTIINKNNRRRYLGVKIN